MADVRVKDLTTTATQHASDDYFDIDGSTNGSRKILASKYAHVDLNSMPAGGYILDGSNDYITVSDNDNLDLGTGDFTLEVYIKTGSDVSTCQEIIGKRLGALGDGFEIYVESGVLKFRKLSSSAQNTISYPISANTLYHFLITKSDSTYSMYINGVQVSYTGSISLTNTLSNSENLVIGKLSAGDYFKGQIYFVRVYNRALSASEIAKLWNNGKPELSQLSYEDRNGCQANLLNNGDCELDSDWIGTNNPTVYERSSTMAYSGTYSWHGVFNNDSSVIRNSCTIFPKKRKYRVTGKIYVVAGTVTVKAQEGGTPFSALGEQTFTANTVWQDIDFEWTHTAPYDSVSINFGNTSSGEAYIDDMLVMQFGCVAEYLPNNAGKFGWLETQNRLHGSTSGSPTTASAGLFEHYKDIKLNVTGDSILTDVVPKEYRLKGILFNNTTANTVVINVGTSGGGTDVVNAQSVPAGLTFVSLAKIFSLTADQTLYITASPWNSASVNVELSMTKY